MVLRKCSKKDPVTKIKALKEFTDLVNSSDVEIVKTALPYFPKVYVLLSTDVDARVREIAQQALLAIVNKVGKNLATILKQVFPAWVCGQYDTHPTAASIATNCFDKAFPAKKVADVFGHCESELLDYFTKNLIVLNPQTVCNPKTHSPEECEAKYQRVLISSLRGYALYLEKISPEKLELSTEKNLAIIECDKFWNLHKNKAPQVRSAFFEALSTLLQHASFLLSKFEEQLVGNVFKSIDESDPALLSHIWTCIILVEVKVENWSKYVNVNKVLLPKLWKILRTSLYPCVIYPNLLPLVSKFDRTMLPDDQLHNFYLKFFENINFGLRNVQMGKAETSAVTSAYYEILQYIMIQIANDKEVGDAEKLSFCSNLLDDHIVAVIFWCIKAEGAFGKHIFHHIANLINYWSKNADSVELYRELLARFWSELYQVLGNSLDTTSNIGKITGSHVELIKNIRNYSTKVKIVKIKFEDQVDSASEKAKEKDTEKDSAFTQQLNELVYKLCSIYTERITSTQEIEFVDSLEVLVKEYQSAELFRHLAKWNNPDEVNICSLYDTFATWLLEPSLRCEAIIEIILVLYKYLKPSEKIDLLNRWIRVPSVQSWIIMRALSYPLCMEPDITKLLKMKEVTDHLVECARQASNGIYKENLIILQKCFFQTEDGNILIDAFTCGKIVEIMCEPLTDEARISQMDQCASFLAQILPVICSDATSKELQQKIFLALFEFSIAKELSDDLSEDTLWEVTTAWQDGLSSNDLTMDNFLLSSCAKIIIERIENISMDKMTVSGMERFTEIVSKLIICSTEQESGAEKSAFVEKLVGKLFAKCSDNELYMENLSLTVQLMHGGIVLRDAENVPDREFLDALDTYLKHLCFNLEVIIKLSCNIKVSEKREAVRDMMEDMEPGDEIEFLELQAQAQEEEATEDYCDMDENLLKEWSDTIFEKFLDVCYGDAVLNVLLMNLKCLHPELETWMIYVQERLGVLMKHLPETISAPLKEKLFEKANAKGGLWANCLMNLLHTKTYSAENGSVLLYEDSVTHAHQDETIISYINILQTFAERVDKKALPITTNLFENYSNLLVKVSASRSLIRNHLDVGDFNEMTDRKIVGNALIVMNEILTKQKTEPYLLYNKDVSQEDPQSVLLVAEIACLLSDVLIHFPAEIDVKRWDFIRIALSSWVLSVSKSCEKFNENKVKVFIAAIFRLNASLFKFILSEKMKSSTQMLQNIIDEWEKVFAREVNLVLIKSFIHIINNLGE
jgi:E3 ubiquitin-protein ligase listerin